MLRSGIVRPLATVIGLFVCLFVLGVSDAWATHFRFATVSWEKDLTYAVPGQYKVHVTIVAGGRWSFPFTPPSGAAPPNACPGQNGNPQTNPPFVATNPNVGS